MNGYKTALSALLLAPIVGGVSIYMIHQYQELKEQAEELTILSEEPIQAVEAALSETAEADGQVTAWQADDLEETTEEDDITQAVIRFHVRANSDSEEDQALKLLVRDRILEELEPKLWKADDRETAREILEENLEEIEAVGAEVIQEAGYTYPIHAYLTTEEFPIKAYGDLLFPAGEYEALRVDIGASNGANWWCVMYPGLCFVDAAGGVVTEEGKEELEQILTPEEYRELLIRPDEDTQIEYRSRIWDWIQGGLIV